MQLLLIRMLVWYSIFGILPYPSVTFIPFKIIKIRFSDNRSAYLWGARLLVYCLLGCPASMGSWGWVTEELRFSKQDPLTEGVDVQMKLWWYRNKHACTEVKEVWMVQTFCPPFMWHRATAGLVGLYWFCYFWMGLIISDEPSIFENKEPFVKIGERSQEILTSCGWQGHSLKSCILH